jgi:heat shock protein HtpX
MANAFATGRSPNNASVAVTSGILEILDTDELRGVLAHELSHVQNRDILVSTVAATLATAIGYIARTAQFSMLTRNTRQDSQRRTNPLAFWLAATLMPIAAALMQFAISRSREYLADESGAETTHEPLALADALQKLEQRVKSAHLDPRDTARASTAPLFIVNPFSGGTLLTLFSTHPPMTKRIERLQKMAARKKSF